MFHFLDIFFFRERLARQASIISDQSQAPQDDEKSALSKAYTDSQLSINRSQSNVSREILGRCFSDPMFISLSYLTGLVMSSYMQSSSS